MLLAELEFFHSRRIAPTRRIALGDSTLPCDPAPGFAGILLGGVLAANVRQLDDDDLLPDLSWLMSQVEEGHRISQPRLRYRLQTDRVGLLRSRLRLVQRGSDMHYDFGDERSTPAQRVLAAVYAAGTVPFEARRGVFGALRRGMRWEGPIGPALTRTLAGADGHVLSAVSLGDPVGWALDVLGFEAKGTPEPRDGLAAPARIEVQRRFRVLLRQAHPDHGGDAADAAKRIADLREARRLLLG